MKTPENKRTRYLGRHHFCQFAKVGWAKLPRPALAPYLHPCRQSSRVLLSLLTYIHVGKA